MSFRLVLGIDAPATLPASQDALSRERSAPLSAPPPDSRSSFHRAGIAPRCALVTSAALHVSIVTLALMWPTSVSRTAIEPSPVPVRLLFVEPDTEAAATASSLPSPASPPMAETDEFVAPPPKQGADPPSPPAPALVAPVRAPTVPKAEPKTRATPQPPDHPVARRSNAARKSPEIDESPSFPVAAEKRRFTDQGNDLAILTAPVVPGLPERSEPSVTRGIRPLDHPDLAYPMAARRAHLQGDVVLRLAVDEAGRLTSVSVERGSGYRILDDAAIANVKLWRFEPAVQGGRPIATVAELPVRFRLAD